MILTKDDTFANGLGLELQIRTKLVRFWSYIKSSAIRIGDDILEIEGSADPVLTEAKNHYWINFEYQGELTTLGGFPVKYHLKDKYQSKRWFEIDLSSKYPGQNIVISSFNEFIRVDFQNGSDESFGNTIGLLGDFIGVERPWPVMVFRNSATLAFFAMNGRFSLARSCSFTRLPNLGSLRNVSNPRTLVAIVVAVLVSLRLRKSKLRPPVLPLRTHWIAWIASMTFWPLKTLIWLELSKLLG
jgi:hypothetical protein